MENVNEIVNKNENIFLNKLRRITCYNIIEKLLFTRVNSKFPTRRDFWQLTLTKMKI